MPRVCAGSEVVRDGGKLDLWSSGCSCLYLSRLKCPCLFLCLLPETLGYKPSYREKRPPNSLPSEGQGGAQRNAMAYRACLLAEGRGEGENSRGIAGGLAAAPKPQLMSPGFALPVVPPPPPPERRLKLVFPLLLNLHSLPTPS